MICQKCGKQIPENALFCRECGCKVVDRTESLNSNNNTGICPKCGSTYDLTAESSFCKTCGFNLKQEVAIKKKDKSLPILIVVLITVIIICAAVIVFVSLNSNEIHEPDAISAYSKDIDDNSDDTAVENSFESESDDSENIDEFVSPTFDTLRASSELAPEGSNTYNCWNIVDGNNDTAWVEGVNGSGIGETLVFSADKNQKISGIMILNGYCKNESLYYKNNRVKAIKISFSDGSVITRKLEDGYLAYNVFNFDEPIICKTVTVIIEDIYEGTDFNDTCISEIEFF